MTPIKSLVLATALSSLFASANAAQAADPSSALTMKPLHGISFDAGAERAVSYFSSESGHCKLVVALAKEPDWDNLGSFSATKVEAAIRAGETTRYTSADGKTFEFQCAADAQAVHFKAIQQVAYSKAQ